MKLLSEQIFKYHLIQSIAFCHHLQLVWMFNPDRVNISLFMTLLAVPLVSKCNSRTVMVSAKFPEEKGKARRYLGTLIKMRTMINTFQTALAISFTFFGMPQIHDICAQLLVYRNNTVPTVSLSA